MRRAFACSLLRYFGERELFEATFLLECRDDDPDSIHQNSRPREHVHNHSRILHRRPLPIRTFYHPLLNENDYIDLSDSCGALVDPGTGDDGGLSTSLSQAPDKALYVNYWRRILLHETPRFKESVYFPFPVNTHGFLYFWRHPLIPIASGLRFRLAQTPDKKGYHRGQDLLTPYGTPWQIPLVALSSPRYTRVMQVLQQDGLVPPQLRDYCRGLERDSTIGPFSQLLFKTWQPFYLDLANQRHKVFFVSQDAINEHRVHDFFPGRRYPFKCMCSQSSTRF